MNILKTLTGFLGGDKGLVTISCNGAVLSFPVDPESFRCSVKNKNTVVNIINAGDYNMIGKTGLKSLTVSSFFPAQKYNFNNYSATTRPYTSVQLIESWRESGTPCKVSVAATPISFDCLIEEFDYGEQDGSGDVYFTLSLTEYRYPQTMSTSADALTGLLGRKPSYLERTGYEFAKKIIQGENPKDAVVESVRAGGLTKEQSGYLTTYENVCRGGGLHVGDILISKAGAIFKNGRKVPDAKIKGIPDKVIMS